ncbi:ECF RNA polymerase sigma factor SigK [Ornithinicoccus halotolerans]|uniref:ECF RNA polymerase sigma factor SigK n=1 Tax=Ornithinicoccus halotolerans TaxID=1748220 RepID=UPI001295F2E7|nr:ECF RNA polymerase sigma factor SigK [Ornithinicoccus halotolerans]
MTSHQGTAELAVLVRAVAEGDQDAFARFYDLTTPRVFGLVVRVLRDRAQAEEVTQEVYLQVWRLADSYDADRGSALAWLLTLAHRRAVDRVRSAQAQSDREAAYESRQTQPAFDSTSEIVQGRLEAGLLQMAVHELSPVQRAAIELAYYQGLTYREVAERLDVPLGTVKTRIRDGLIRLRRELEGGAP